MLPFHCFSKLSFLTTVFFPFVNWRVTDLEKESLTFHMTLSKKSYKTHQLLIKKHPGIPQPSFQPTQDFKQGSKMSSSNGILSIHSHVSKFHGNNLELPRNEEGMLPSPSEPPEVSQPTASNNEKAAAQNEAAITLKGTFRYLKK